MKGISKKSSSIMVPRGPAEIKEQRDYIRDCMRELPPNERTADNARKALLGHVPVVIRVEQ